MCHIYFKKKFRHDDVSCARQTLDADEHILPRAVRPPARAFVLVSELGFDLAYGALEIGLRHHGVRWDHFWITLRGAVARGDTTRISRGRGTNRCAT